MQADRIYPPMGYNDFISQPWTGFQNLDWFCHYPIAADLIPIKFDRVRDIFIIDKLSWSRLLISECVMPQSRPNSLDSTSVGQQTSLSVCCVLDRSDTAALMKYDIN